MKIRLSSFLAGVLSERRIFILKEKTSYPHPFSVAYWKESAAECKSIRSLSFAALLCALAIVIEKFNIPLAPSVYVSMSFLVIALCSMLTGPVMAIFCGVIVDLIGAVSSGYTFFFGYTLTAVLTAVIYALFLYRAKFSFTRLVLAKGIVNLFVNTLLGSVWRVVLYGNSTFQFYVSLAGIKNLVLFPLEIFLLFVFFRALQTPLKQLGTLPAGFVISCEKKELIRLGIIACVGVLLLIPFALHYDAIKAFLSGLF